MIVDALVMRFNTPKEVDRGKRKATRRLSESNFGMVDKVHSLFPDFLYPWEPARRRPGIGEASEFLVIRVGDQGDFIRFGPLSPATG